MDLTVFNVANGDIASALIINSDTGIITSDSRAINIGGVGGRVTNYGKILSTANPRNGTVYGDVTADNVFIDNFGLIDVGKGNDGDAISLELGVEVEGGIYNQGIIKGRGLPGVENPDNQAAGVRLYWVEASGADVSVFNGDIENSDILSAENGAAVIIEDRVQLNGKIINYGLIKGGVVEQGKLAIDASEAEGNITLENNGVIRGDVLLTEGDDFYDGTKGRVRGTVFGNGGDDTLMGGQYKDILNGGTGNDELYGKAGRDVFQFSSDLIDGVKDIDVIKDFSRGDKFDFSQYLEAGGDITYSFGTGELLIELNEEDLIVVQGNIWAAEKSLLDQTELSDLG